MSYEVPWKSGKSGFGHRVEKIAGCCHFMMSFSSTNVIIKDNVKGFFCIDNRLYAFWKKISI